MCSCKWRSIYWPVFFSARDWPTWFMKPGRLIWNADVETVKYTPPSLFPLLYLSGWKVACTRVSHPYSLNYFSWTHRAVTSCGGCGSCSSFSALYPGARNCFEKDCCFSPQWHCEAFSRVSTDSGGCRSDCSLSPDDPEPWR